MLFAAVIVLVLTFRSSTNLATACTPVGDRHDADRHPAVGGRCLYPLAGRIGSGVLPLCALFPVIDLAFLIANGEKLLTGIGAWVPLFIGIAAFTMMRTRRGRELPREEIRKDGIQLDTFLPGLMLAPPVGCRAPRCP